MCPIAVSGVSYCGVKCVSYCGVRCVLLRCQVCPIAVSGVSYCGVRCVLLRCQVCPIAVSGVSYCGDNINHVFSSDVRRSHDCYDTCL